MVTASGSVVPVSAATTYRGAPLSTTHTVNTARREKRCPIAPYSSAPVSPPAPNSAVSSPMSLAPPSSVEACTGSRTAFQP